MSAALLAGTLAACSIALLGASANELGRTAVRLRAGAGSPPRSGWRAKLDVDGLRSGTWLLPASGLGGMVLGGILAGLPGAIVGGGGGLALPVAIRRRRASRERELLDEQLADAVAAIGAGLRAGLSLEQALRYASTEGERPLAESIGQVVERAEMGMPLGDAIEAWSSAHGSPDVRLMAGVLALHRRSGGDLPTVLDRLAGTLRARRAATREIRSLTAQARMSGAILGLLPIGFFAFLAVTAREDMEAALRSTAGLSAIVAGLVMQGIAFLWIRRLLRVA